MGFIKLLIKESSAIGRVFSLLATVQFFISSSTIICAAQAESKTKTADAKVSQNLAKNKSARNSNMASKKSESKSDNSTSKSSDKASKNGDSCASKSDSSSPAPTTDSKSTEPRKEVLLPSQFFGLASFGYAAAKACPEVMEKLFCYCGCDMTDSHNSLLDCFTSTHGVDCHICQEEALLASKLHKDGVSMAEIQQTIDDKYSSQYPFEQPTPTYQKYKQSGRLYAKDAANTAPVKFGTQAAGPEAPDEPKGSKTPKLKPGKTMPKCCAHGEHPATDKAKTK